MTTILHKTLHRVRQGAGRDRSFPVLFTKFKDILALNNQVLERISQANGMLSGDYVFDEQYVRSAAEDMTALVERLVYNLDSLAPGKYAPLHAAFNRIRTEIQTDLAGQRRPLSSELLLSLDKLSLDRVEEVGGKNANLAEVRNVLGLRTSPGFAITTTAYHAFLEHNRLRSFIQHRLDEWTSGSADLQQTSRDIQERIRKGTVPDPLRKALAQYIQGMSGDRSLRLAFRSSAVGEDGDYSFAGQYSSILNVKPSGAEDAYREVIASLYSERALAYAQRVGNTSSDDMAMAVLCQQMVDAKASGVLYTLDPTAPEKEQMVLNVTWGLGAATVAGEARADRLVVSRCSPYQPLAMEVVRKETALYGRGERGTAAEPLPSDMQTRLSLTPDEISRLAHTALLIERHFHKPQDIEFAVDSQGSLIVLQTRRLLVQPDRPIEAKHLVHLDRRYPVLMRDTGVIARKGIAFGKVFVVRNQDDLERIPDGAILVSRLASPVLARVLPKAAGIITDIGAATGHLATICREFRRPAIFNCGQATSILKDGMDITLDAEENIVYQGTVKELGQYKMLDDPIEETREFRLLRRVLRRIEPLHLLDPADKSFVPEACRSLHDVTRFVHEKAIQALIDYHVYSSATTAKNESGRLEWELPLDLFIIDIGNGVADHASRKISMQELQSAPLKALLGGMTVPGAWNNEPMSVDFAGFMSSLTRTFSTELAEPRHIGQNLAVVSRDYANVSFRLGYHFAMIDAFLSQRITDNYIYFRFFGGVTEEARRSRRARLLADILSEYDFRVQTEGDLVIGRAKGLDVDGMSFRLHMLGALIGFTRQLDVCMVNDTRVREFNHRFNSLLEETHE